MKEALKEEIGVWKENLKAVIYVLVLDISASIAQIYKQGINSKWSIAGVVSVFFILVLYAFVWRKLTKLINLLKEVENG
jgi:membrane protein YdbS with pleckstrin-like domain